MIRKIITAIKEEIKVAQNTKEIPDGYVMGLRMAMHIVWEETGWKESKVQEKEPHAETD